MKEQDTQPLWLPTQMDFVKAHDEAWEAIHKAGKQARLTEEIPNKPLNERIYSGLIGWCLGFVCGAIAASLKGF